MTNTEEMLNTKKYVINDYITSKNRMLILNHLDISQPTFWRKSNVLIGDKGGFELCQLKQIADVLEREILDLLTLEAKFYYGFIKWCPLKSE